jgi:hypothetical protein
MGGIAALAAVTLVALFLFPSLLPAGLLGNDDGKGGAYGSDIARPRNISPSAESTVFGPNVTLVWTTVTGADSYSIMIAVPGTTVAALNLTSANSSHALNGLLPNGEYLWSVRAMRDNVYGPPSEVTAFSMRTTLDRPVMISPSDGSIHINSVPTLRWGSVLDALDYRLQIARDNDFADLLADVRLEGTSYRPTFAMEDDAVYSWRVSAHNGDAWSPWSVVRQFSHDHFLAAPVPLAPAAGSIVDDRQVNLTWSTVDGAAGYRLQVSASEDFAIKVADAEVAEPWYVMPSELDSGASYFWRVQAVSSATRSSWSGAVTFTVAQEAFSFSYSWHYNGRQQWLNGSAPGSDYYRLSGLPRTYDYASYVTDNDPTVIAVATYLKAQADGKRYDPASYILSFVQSLEYTSDFDTKGKVEYPRYPVETLVDGGGDCEDTAALFASLVQCPAVGIDAVLLMYTKESESGHMAVGIEGDHYGTYYVYNGRNYFYCETTGEGFRIGMFPQELQGHTVEVLPC